MKHDGSYPVCDSIKSNACWLLTKMEKETDCYAPVLHWTTLETEHWCRQTFSLNKHDCSYGGVRVPKINSRFLPLSHMNLMDTRLDYTTGTRTKDCMGSKNYASWLRSVCSLLAKQLIFTTILCVHKEAKGNGRCEQIWKLDLLTFLWDIKSSGPMLALTFFSETSVFSG